MISFLSKITAPNTFQPSYATYTMSYSLKVTIRMWKILSKNSLSNTIAWLWRILAVLLRTSEKIAISMIKGTMLSLLYHKIWLSYREIINSSQSLLLMEKITDTESLKFSTILKLTILEEFQVKVNILRNQMPHQSIKKIVTCEGFNIPQDDE